MTEGSGEALQPQCLSCCASSRWVPQNPEETRSWSLGTSSAPVETQLILFIQRDLSSSASKANKSGVRREIFQVPSYPKSIQFVPGMTIIALCSSTSTERGEEHKSIFPAPKAPSGSFLLWVWAGQDTKGMLSFNMGQDQQSEGTKGFICNEITGTGPLEMSLEAQPLI